MTRDRVSVMPAQKHEARFTAKCRGHPRLAFFDRDKDVAGRVKPAVTAEGLEVRSSSATPDVVGKAPAFFGPQISGLVDPPPDVAGRAIFGNFDEAHVDLVENLRPRDRQLLDKRNLHARVAESNDGAGIIPLL